MEPKGSLTCSQQPTAGSNPRPDESSPVIIFAFYDPVGSAQPCPI
jgi:hypothetical protein